MTVAQVGRIDIVAETPDGRIALGIVEPGGWDDTATRRDQLVRKLGTYLDYMHSPEYEARFGRKEPTVLLVTQAEPPPEILELLRATEAASGIPCEVQRMDAGAEPRPVGAAQPAEPAREGRQGPESRARAPAGSRAPTLDEVLAFTRRVPAKAQRDRQRIQATRQVFGLIALLAGVVGGVYAWSQTGSIALGLFVFALTNHIIGRGMADVVTDPQKVRRAFFFLLPAALSTGILLLAWRQWEILWLAVVVGFFGGLMLNAFLAPRLFPRISQEEQQDSAERMREAFGRRHDAG